MTNSPEYLTIIQLTPELTNAFRDDLVDLSGEFLSAGFISDDNADNLRNQHNGANLRAASLVQWIRNRIQLEPKRNYRTFIDVLKRRLADHESILRRLDETYKELGGTVETGISSADGSSNASDLNGASRGSKKASKSAVKFDPLDQVVDYGSKAPVHIGQIAERVQKWEGLLSDRLDLSPADVESIKTKHNQDLKAQTREALLTWKERNGPDATYNNLIRIFEHAENRECADFIRKLTLERVKEEFLDVYPGPEDQGPDGKGPSKLTVTILVLLVFSGICAVGCCVYAISTLHDRGTPGPRSDDVQKLNDLIQAVKEIGDDDIQKLNDLIQAVKEIGNWRGLCTNLGVNETKMEKLKFSRDTVDTKKADCLQAYFNSGEAKWSDVIKAVAMQPISNKRVAKQIAKAHGLSYGDIMEDEL